MEDEIQQLREMVLQLKAENEQLRHEHTTSLGGPSGSTSASPGPTVYASGAGVSAPVIERLVVIPRDRKCPMFSGKSGISIAEWAEEVQACARARYLPAAEQSLFMADHLEGEAKEEIKFCPREEQRDPGRVLAILKELYGCSQSYVTLQQAFFSWQQLEGETLQEFSLALMSLMAHVERQAPDGIPNADVLLRDQFVEHVLDGSLRRELKQLVRRQPTITLLELRGEAIRWEREGLPGGTRGRSVSLPTAYGLQCGVQGRPHQVPQARPQEPGLDAVMDLLKRQQEQLNQLTMTVASLQAPPPLAPICRLGPLICRRCQQPGHFARECDGERAPPRRRVNSVAGYDTQARSSSSQQSGN
ncbi:uncharacterized protein LOC130539468 [Takifugu flavidus]|uniref:uncharacterized protein LOC130539468 n=1 Tax=Takifugu flavidus TaxID=433684 RepID=UPI00254402AF|nr:uncharacterized protein LOC130539468 [Takifugu flavidus]XP_056913810.1 uncharacterized protein LOC130539468 [Takifugu flavidus]XP_056913811.1 uncharacterized protein LOC130539468 [Takifugu flavidus]